MPGCWGYLELSLPDLYRVLPAASQAEFVTRLRELEADPKLAFAKDRLHALREKLSAK